MDGHLRNLFRQHLPEFHWVAVETSMTGGGVPDANYCVDGIEGWIEYKVTSGYAVGLRPAQVGWLERRTRAGGRTFIAVRRVCKAGVRREAADELWLFSGAEARELLLYGLKDGLLEGRWQGGPRSWKWPEIGALLRV